MARKNRRLKKPVLLLNQVALRSEYLALSIIQTGSKPKRSMQLFKVGALIVAGAALVFALGR